MTMTLDQVARLLVVASMYDNRKVTDDAVHAWYAALWHRLGEHASYRDLEMAVNDHYSKSDKWIMPTHVGDFVELLRKTRRRCIKVQPPERGLLNELGNPVSQEAFEKVEDHRRRSRVAVENGRYQPDPDMETILAAVEEMRRGGQPDLAPWTPEAVEIEQ